MTNGTVEIAVVMYGASCDRCGRVEEDSVPLYWKGDRSPGFDAWEAGEDGSLLCDRCLNHVGGDGW